ncbi:hypothetical protein AMS68_007894 [Peltaster fructicola]|uniref:DUF2382 domain-containing protein n=1 Tax=Peltaster fructicola TaxID=286661 RepID=A0A6H0Y5P9_9PEZI|nr:hypothetical protein AMS68_007894 [Peltaster fructicola]
MSQANAVPGDASTRQTTRSVSEQELVSDFKHLGIAVRADANDTAQREIGGAAIAARVAYARHLIDKGEPDRQSSLAQPAIESAAISALSDGRRAVNTDPYHDSTQPSATGPEGGKRLQHKPDLTNLREANVATSTEQHHNQQSNLAQGYGNHRSSRATNDLPVDDLNYREPASELPSNPDTKETVIAKPVTHETVKVQHHEIRQEVIHRDIHEYHEVTKILPVVETVVLPARHFIETADGGKVEIPEPKGAIGVGRTEFVKTTTTLPNSSASVLP